MRAAEVAARGLKVDVLSVYNIAVVGAGGVGKEMLRVLVFAGAWA